MNLNIWNADKRKFSRFSKPQKTQREEYDYNTDGIFSSKILKKRMIE